MKTPTGRECKFFYGDYYRGRNFEECRALANPKDRAEWESSYCQNCPVPEVLLNNACPNMVLTTYIKKSLFRRKIQISAYCSKSHDFVKDPNIGCGLCHFSEKDKKS